MLITVTKQGFVWQSPAGENQYCRTLWGPKNCRYERIKVIRSGKEIDEAVICSIGTHASYDGFAGLEKITGSPYQQIITAEMFKVGDKLQIGKLPEDMSEEDYWHEMTLKAAEPLVE